MMNPNLFHRLRSALNGSISLVLLLSLLVPLLPSSTLAAPAAAPVPSEQVAIQAAVRAAVPHAPNACSLPRTRTIRGKSVTFDQCYQRSFNHNGTAYSVDVYYTETNTAANQAQCTADENAANRCEHALPNNDDGNGDNVEAVAMADEAEFAVRFYDDRNLNFLPAGNTTMNVYIAEDPRVGGIINGDGMYADDDWMIGDQLAKRLLALHEIHHLVQTQYDDLIGWNDFYGEGNARAIEDRADPTLDADLGHLFIPEVNGILGSDANRAADLTTINYRSVLWWTWLWDQYRQPADAEPVIGWNALRDFYLELKTESDQWKAVRDFISAQGSNLTDDFIDYTLALYAYRFNPGDPRLTYLDNEIRNNTTGLSNHSVFNSGPAFTTVNQPMNPRSSRYWEYNPASQCDYIAFTFDGNSDTYGFSLMTVDGGVLQNRWTSVSSAWARTVRSSDLDRVVGVVTALDTANSATVGHGCVSPTINIKDPTTAKFEMVGLADNPRKFIVRVDVDGEDGSGVAGLVASDFGVALQPAGGGAAIPADILNATYVQDDYWLLVQAPGDGDGAQNGLFYNLTVTLGSQSDTENSAVLYVERTQDVVIVLDRSGSMGGSTGKIEAARNAAALLTNELAGNDQGGFVAFDQNSFLRVNLDEMTAPHRTAMESSIAAETPGGSTSIGDGMVTAAQEHDANGIADNLCSFVLLSDGHENEAAFWADVQAQVVDNGCAIHAIALGPGTNEPLMQAIAASVPGGSYDYATTSGDVPISAAANAASVNAAAVNAPDQVGSLGWENNLSRIYDAKITRIAGRQRIFSAVGEFQQPIPGAAAAPSQVDQYRFYVDEASDELVISTAWQISFAGEFTAGFTQLQDPDGNPVDLGMRRLSPNGTNEVWRVPGPKEGFWSLIVDDLPDDYYVSATALTDYELYLFLGTPVGDLIQGIGVPVYGVLVGPDGPLIGADVVAEIGLPDGSTQTLRLYDDGNHSDVEPDDGVYANLFNVTNLADLTLADPEQIVEGEEPQFTGSYQVKVTAKYDPLTREAQDSFVISPDDDDDGDGMPNRWEVENDLDPQSSGDARRDDDGDRLLNVCEFQQGTNPHDSDTDDGGESDGSEVPMEIDEFNRCTPTTTDPLDPHDGTDDRVGPIRVVQATPEATLEGVPFIKIFWSLPDLGELLRVDLWRRPIVNGEPADDWQVLAVDRTGQMTEDRDVEDGKSYQYRLIPYIQTADGEAIGTIVESNVVMATSDPHAPAGSILINDGAAETGEQLVKLTVSADDSGDSHDGAPDEEAAPGTPINELQMRISNSPDFTGVEWQPFQLEVTDWDLGALSDGDVATVYIQFRDAAGNISDTGLAQVDTIVFSEDATPPPPPGTDVYLPIAARD